MRSINKILLWNLTRLPLVLKTVWIDSIGNLQSLEVKQRKYSVLKIRNKYFLYQNSFRQLFVSGPVNYGNEFIFLESFVWLNFSLFQVYVDCFKIGFLNILLILSTNGGITRAVKPDENLLYLTWFENQNIILKQ